MNQTINLKILLLIVALLGSSMENARRQAIQKYGAMRPAETRQLQWSDSIRNAKTK